MLRAHASCERKLHSRAHFLSCLRAVGRSGSRQELVWSLPVGSRVHSLGSFAAFPGALAWSWAKQEQPGLGAGFTAHTCSSGPLHVPSDTGMLVLCSRGRGKRGDIILIIAKLKFVSGKCYYLMQLLQNCFLLFHVTKCWIWMEGRSFIWNEGRNSCS